MPLIDEIFRRSVPAGNKVPIVWDAALVNLLMVIVVVEVDQGETTTTPHLFFLSDGTIEHIHGDSPF